MCRKFLVIILIILKISSMITFGLYLPSLSELKEQLYEEKYSSNNKLKMIKDKSLKDWFNKDPKLELEYIVKSLGDVIETIKQEKYYSGPDDDWELYEKTKSKNKIKKPCNKSKKGKKKNSSKTFKSTNKNQNTKLCNFKYGKKDEQYASKSQPISSYPYKSVYDDIYEDDQFVFNKYRKPEMNKEHGMSIVYCKTTKNKQHISHFYILFSSKKHFGIYKGVFI